MPRSEQRAQQYTHREQLSLASLARLLARQAASEFVASATDTPDDLLSSFNKDIADDD